MLNAVHLRLLHEVLSCRGHLCEAAASGCSSARTDALVPPGCPNPSPSFTASGLLPWALLQVSWPSCVLCSSQQCSCQPSTCPACSSSPTLLRHGKPAGSPGTCETMCPSWHACAGVTCRTPTCATATRLTTRCTGAAGLSTTTPCTSSPTGPLTGAQRCCDLPYQQMGHHGLLSTDSLVVKRCLLL